MHFNPQLFKASIIQTKLFGPLDFELSRFHRPTVTMRYNALEALASECCQQVFIISIYSNFSISYYYMYHCSRYDTFFLSKSMDIFFSFLYENICCGTHWKCLGKAPLMSIHKACFHGGIRKKNIF